MEFTKEEKHTPVIEVNGSTVKITVPNHPPQSEEHYISKISLFASKGGELIGEKQISPDEEAVAVFEVSETNNLYATENCNLHGDWDSEGEFLGI